MKLYKTDKRFELYDYGFDCYIEFSYNDWNSYNEYTIYCRKTLGNEFWKTRQKVYENGGWKGVYRHRTRRGVETKRIFFRGEKYHTLLLMALPAKDNKTFYL